MEAWKHLASALIPIFKSLKDGYRVIAEPGRVIVGSAAF